MKSDPEVEKDAKEIYPGLIIHPERQGGSITLGASRFPLWSLLPHLLLDGANIVCEDWDMPSRYGHTPEQLQKFMAEFSHHLLDVRNDWSELLCLMALKEKCENDQADVSQVKEDLRVCLQKCLDSLT